MPSNTLVTLGPVGTDSEHAARQVVNMLDLSLKIKLFSNFDTAINFAKDSKEYLLMPCAYKNNHEQFFETWGDVNFNLEEDGVLTLWKAIILPLKVMCIAKRKEVKLIKSCSIHPATDFFKNKYLDSAQTIYFDSKPEAVKVCAEGKYDSCIGSEDIINQYLNLEIIKKFNINMCWTLYKPSIN